jgi:hypothetical protein
MGVSANWHPGRLPWIAACSTWGVIPTLPPPIPALVIGEYRKAFWGHLSDLDLQVEDTAEISFIS